MSLMTAEEIALRIYQSDWDLFHKQELLDFIAEQIKSAEAQAYERGLEDAAKVADRHVNCMNMGCVINDLGCIGFIANELRALKRAPEVEK